MTILTLALDWAAAYVVHSTLLLLLAWATSRLLRDRRIALQETLWRGALFGALVTASLQVGLPALAPVVATSQPLVENALLVEEGRALSATPLADAGPAAEGASIAAADASLLTLPSWTAWTLLAAWAGIALAGLARLALAGLRLTLRLRQAEPLSEGPIHAELARLSLAMKLPRPATLLVSRALGTPFAAGIRRPRIVVPAEAFERLEPVEQKGLVAHEAAHLARRDPAWRLAALVVERVFFFQPLNRLARARLQEAAELLADEQAAHHAGGGQDLARCLVEVAGWRSPVVERAAVVGAVSSSSALTRRVERLLAGRRDAGRGAATPLTLALLLAVALVPGATWSLGEEPPRPPEAPDAPVPRAPAVVEISVDAPDAPAAPPEVIVGAMDRSTREELEKHAREHRLRVEELLAREDALRARMEELALRARETGDEDARARLAQLEEELALIRATRLEERARFMDRADELGATNIVVRERARDEALRAYAVAREARAPRAERSLEAERARIEAEVSALREREQMLMQRLEELEAREEARRKAERDE